MKKHIRFLIAIAVILGGIFLLKVYPVKEVSPLAQKSKGRHAPIEKTTVQAAVLKKTDLNLTLSYIGSLKAKDEVKVFSKVSGKLAQYLAEEGDSVQQGQAIALVDRDETGLKYELAKVESPIPGVLARTLLDKGANILPSGGLNNGTALAIVVNMDEVIVNLNISEQDIPYIKKGLDAEIKVDSYPDESFSGRITKVSEVIDHETRTLPVEISIANLSHKLKSGMFCRMKIIARRLENRLFLPQDALVQEADADYVFVIEGGYAKKKKVTLGIREDSKVEVLEGLEEGRQVIIFGQQGLKDGSAVNVIQ